MTQTNEPPLISDGLRYWVDQEFPRGIRLKFLKRHFERSSSGPIVHWHGHVLNLHLDKTTNRLTVEADFVEALEPEVVDYDDFKAFVAKQWP